MICWGGIERPGVGQGKETGGRTGKSTGRNSFVPGDKMGRDFLLKMCCLFLSFLIRAHYKYMAV